MGTYLWGFSQLKKRETNDKGRGKVPVSGVTQRKGGLVIIRDEAWWWGVGGLKNGNLGNRCI